MATGLSRKILLRAFSILDQKLPDKIDLLIGGGAAMVIAYGETEATYDVDGIPIKSVLSFEQLKPFMFKVAEELELPKDWINPYFHSYTHVLPADYRNRIREIFSGKELNCFVLGPEDLLIMKLMAGRQKDDRHVRRLLKIKGIKLDIIEGQLEKLKQRLIHGAEEALDRLDDFKNDLGIA